MKNVLVMITCALICFLSACSNVKDVPSIVTIEKGFRKFPIVSEWDVIGIGFQIIFQKREWLKICML